MTNGAAKKPAASTHAAHPARQPAAKDQLHISAKRARPATPARPEPVKPAAAAVTRPAAAPAQPEEQGGLLHGFIQFWFGNTENKLFQIKFNLLHLKDIFLGAGGGFFQPVADLVKNLSGVIAGGMARLAERSAAIASETGPAGRLVGLALKAARPVRSVAGIGLRFLEKSAPLFGIMTVFQDLFRAVSIQGDKTANTANKALGWATVALSAIGATASTIAAWGLAGAAASAPTGIGAVGFGTIAIVAFLLSLLTGYLATPASEQKKG